MALSRNAKAVLIAGSVAAGIYILANSRAGEAAADAIGSLGGSDGQAAPGFSAQDAYVAGAAAGYNAALLDVKTTDNTDGGATSPSGSPTLPSTPGGSGSTNVPASPTPAQTSVTAGDTLSSAGLFDVSPWTAVAAAGTVAAGAYTVGKVYDVYLKGKAPLKDAGSVTPSSTKSLKAPSTSKVTKGALRESEGALDAGSAALKAADREALVGGSSAAKSGMKRPTARVGGALATTGLALFAGSATIANANWSYDKVTAPAIKNTYFAARDMGASPEAAAWIGKAAGVMSFPSFVGGAIVGGAYDVGKGLVTAAAHPIDTARSMWGDIDRTYEEHGVVKGTLFAADDLLFGARDFFATSSGAITAANETTTSPNVTTGAASGVTSQGGVSMSETGFLPRPTSSPMAASPSSIPSSGTPIYAIGAGKAGAGIAAATGRNIIVHEQVLNTGSAAHMALIDKANAGNPLAGTGGGEARRRATANERLRETYAAGMTKGVTMSRIDQAEAQKAGSMIGYQNAAAHYTRGHMTAAVKAKYETALSKVKSARPSNLVMLAPRATGTRRNERQ